MRAALSRIGRNGAMVAVAVVISSAGGAYAIDQISSKDIERSAVKSKHVKDNGIKSKDVKDGTLTEDDFSGGLPAGEQGPEGPQGEEGPQGPSGASVFDEAIPSGETIYGVLDSQQPLASGKKVRIGHSFPVPAPEPVGNGEVNFSVGSSGGPTDGDPDCTGTHLAPTAPPGKVCLYASGASGAGPVSGEGALGGNGSRYGFVVELTSSGGNVDFVGIGGVWAYTAP